MEELKEKTSSKISNSKMTDDLLSNDCEVLYEKLIKNNENVETRSATSSTTRDNDDCKNFDKYSEYPSYVKEEIELFEKLEKSLNSTKSTKIQIPIKDEIETLKHNNTSEDNDSGIELEVLAHCYPDSTDCKVLGIKNKKILEPVPETVVIELETEEDSEVPRKKRKEKEIDKKEEEINESENVNEKDKDKDKGKRKLSSSSSKCEVCKKSLKSLFNDLKNDLSVQLESMLSGISTIRNNKKRVSLKRKSNRKTNNNLNVRTCRLRCNVCEVITESRKALFRHYMTAHSDERPHQCKLCPNNYKKSYHLKRHHMSKHRKFK